MPMIFVALIALLRSETKLVYPDDADDPDDDQVERDDVIQQPRHDQDQDPGDQGHERSDAQGNAHGCLLLPAARRGAALEAWTAAAENEEHDREDQADDEQDPCDLRRNAGDSAE